MIKLFGTFECRYEKLRGVYKADIGVWKKERRRWSKIEFGIIKVTRFLKIRKLFRICMFDLWATLGNPDEKQDSWNSIVSLHFNEFLYLNQFD